MPSQAQQQGRREHQPRLGGTVALIVIPITRGTVGAACCTPAQQIHQYRDETEFLHERRAGPSGGGVGIGRPVADVEEGQGGIPRRVVPSSSSSSRSSSRFWAGTADQHLLVHSQHAPAAQPLQWVVNVRRDIATSIAAAAAADHPDRVGVPDQILGGPQHLRRCLDGVEDGY